MDFIETLQALSSKIQKQKSIIQTEEAAKTAFVLPFIGALGYDIFDPSEVVPEFTADVGIKKGEKCDYAILRDGRVTVLVECKAPSANLGEQHASQLFRYFSVTDARIAILTDGIVYRFYSDIEHPNKMDETPFMELNMLDIQEYLIPDVKRLTKQQFNLDEIRAVAGELKYARQIKKILGEEMGNPSEEFVKFFARRVYTGLLTQTVRDLFAALTKKAFTQFINETINDRLRSAMTEPPQEPIAPVRSATATQGIEGQSPPPDRVATTDEELEGFYIVKSVVRQVVDPSRVVHRDTGSYFGILLDDTNRKPICRLHLSGKNKFVTLFGDNKQMEKQPLQSLDDLYRYADRLKATVAMYDSGGTLADRGTAPQQHTASSPPSA